MDGAGVAPTLENAQFCDHYAKDDCKK
jgi:hypothetical protein